MRSRLSRRVYFWDDLPEAFAEVARVLKTGGRFLLCSEMSDPANEMWTSRIDGMRVYSAERLETLLAAAGFADIAVYRRKKGGVVHRSTQTGPKRPKRRKAMNAIKILRSAIRARLRKPVGFTILANLVNIVPFCLDRGGECHFPGLRRQRHAARHRTAVDDLRDTGRPTWRPWHWPNARLTAPISGVPTK